MQCPICGSNKFIKNEEALDTCAFCNFELTSINGEAVVLVSQADIKRHMQSLSERKAIFANGNIDSSFIINGELAEIQYSQDERNELGNGKIVIIPNTVKRISDRAFHQAMALQRVFIPNSVVAIGSCEYSGYQGAFGKCDILTHIVFQQESACTTIGKGAFFGTGSAYGVKLIVENFPQKIKAISQYAFSNFGCEDVLVEIFDKNNATKLIRGEELNV